MIVSQYHIVTAVCWIHATFASDKDLIGAEPTERHNFGVCIKEVLYIFTEIKIECRNAIPD